MNKADYENQILEARGRIKLMINRAAGRYPLHANILERMVLQADPRVRTMGVTVHGDDVLLLFAPAFVNAIKLDELLGVLIHEVHHVLFKHILKDPKDYPDEWARIVSEEVTVNEFVKEPLPFKGIELSDFPALPPMESTDARYERLQKLRRRPAIGQIPMPGQMAGDGSGDSQGNDDSAGGEKEGSEGQFGNSASTNKGVGSSVEPGDSDGNGSGRSQDGDDSASDNQQRKGGQRGKHASTNEEGNSMDRGDSDRNGDGGANPIGNLVDDHGVWRDALDDPARSADAVNAVIKDAVCSTDPKALDKSLIEALAKEPGIGAGAILKTLAGDRMDTLSWERLLRRYVGQVLNRGLDLRHPSRRCPDLVGVVPGRRRLSGKPKILAVIDTSASVTDEELVRISNELGRLARRYEVVVVECDYEIQRVYPYRPVTSVQGRGGTSFEPPFERIFLLRQRPDLIIYFTDGFGLAPVTPPEPPVIWCLTAIGGVPAPWGRELRMGRASNSASADEN